MKIGIIVDSLDDSSGGISVYTENLAREILEIDKKNEYVLIHHRENDKEIFKNKELIVPLKKIPFAREYRKIIQLPKILEKEGFDIIHETTQIGPFFRKSKFKKVVTIHDLAPLKFPKTQSWLTFFHHKIGLKKILKNIDKVITVSESSKKDILEFFKIDEAKIKVIYEGYKKLEIGEDCLGKYGIKKPYLLYVGTLEPRKNVVGIIKAFKQSNVDCQLVIGGKKGWKYKEIFKAVKELGIEGKVHFPGFIADEDLGYLYKNAIAFVFPSLYEGFGLPVLEAMHCGCPVITSNVSSLPEVAGDACILVDPDNVDEIAGAILRVQDRKKREDMIKKGYGQAKKFSWRKCAEETLKIYEEMY